MGKLFKWLFIIFNVLMVFWLIGGMGAATDGMEAMSEAQRAGSKAGAGIGAAIIMGIWIVGDIILGMFVMFTRPKS